MMNKVWSNWRREVSMMEEDPSAKGMVENQVWEKEATLARGILHNYA